MSAGLMVGFSCFSPKFKGIKSEEMTKEGEEKNWVAAAFDKLKILKCS